MTTEDALRRIITNGEVLHKWLHGNENETVTTDGGAIPTISNLAKRASALLEVSLTASSVSQTTVATGAKVFTIASNKGFKPGQWLVIAATGATMLGQVVSYNNTSLNVNVDSVQGSGTFNSWSIAMTGKPGPAGKDGKDGTGGGGGGVSAHLITKMPWEE